MDRFNENEYSNIGNQNIPHSKIKRHSQYVRSNQRNHVKSKMSTSLDRQQSPDIAFKKLQENQKILENLMNDTNTNQKIIEPRASQNAFKKLKTDRQNVVSSDYANVMGDTIDLNKIMSRQNTDRVKFNEDFVNKEQIY